MFAVLVYHAELGVPGAALAVSQFFTLSGFLITALVLRRDSFHAPGQLLPFWTRRYRRLAPASLITLGGVLLFGATIATEQQLDDLPGTVLAAIGQVANWHFIFSDISYVEIFNAPSPLQHFWSLAIEEQFYLVMPLTLLALFRLGRSLRFVTVTFATGAIASSVWMFALYEGGASIDRLYYGTDTRAAEILIGCVLALLLHQRPLRLSHAGRTGLAIAGCCAAMLTYWAWFTVEILDPVLYRGGFFVHGILAAILILTVLAAAGPVNAALSVRPLAALGRLSYTVYCFHWPLYLWLTPDRTGIDGWALFALRAGASIGLAAVSVRFVEGPIRYGTRRTTVRRLRPLPVAFASCVCLVIVGAVLVSQRDVETDLAGLGERAALAAPVSADGTKVLIVHDERGSDVADRLASTDEEHLTVRTAPPFRCEYGTDGDPDLVCDNWEKEWSRSIRSFDPDIVFFHVTDFDVSGIVDRLDLQGEARLRWTTEQLQRGIDVLSARGARVAWSVATLPGDQALLRRAGNPFWEAMNRVAVADPDVRQLQGTGWYEDLIEDLSAFQRPDDPDRTRVLVVGDSVSRTIGYGLERWGTTTGDYLVWSAGTEGCGLVSEGWTTDRAGREVPVDSKCRTAATTWRDQVDTFQPDIVVVSTTLADIQRRRLDEWEEPLVPGDDAFDDYLVDTYSDAYDIFSSSGAQVVWITPLCYEDALGIFDEPGGGSAADPERIDYVRDVIYPRLGESRPDIRFFDLHEIVCPDGRFAAEMDGLTIRPDGAHFSPEGAIWLAEKHGEDLLEGRDR